MKLAAVDAAGYLYDAGFRIGQGLVNALAVFAAESSFDTDATNTAGNTPPSQDRGWVQINSYWHPEVTDECAFDPGCAAKAAWTISRKGTDFGAWAAWNNGAYKPHLEMAYAAADAIQRLRGWQQQVSALGAQLTAAQLTATSLAQKVTDLTGQTAQLQQQVSALTADDESLQAQLTVAKESLADMQAELDRERGRVAAITNNLDAYLADIRASVLA